MKNRKKRTLIIFISLLLIFIIVITTMIIRNNQRNRSQLIQRLTTYADEKFKSDFDEYISKLNISDISISGTYEFVEESFDNNTLYITCFVKYSSNNISNYFTDDYDSADAKKLCELMKSVDAVKKDNKFYTYSFIDVGDVSITIQSDNSFYGITIYGDDNNKYAYEYVVDCDEVLINDDYVYMESDGSYTPASSKSTSSDFEVTDDDELGTCWALAKDVVEAQLKSPSSAKFPFSYADEDVSISKSGSTYTVKSWVEAENSFGATLRSDFTVTMTRSGSKFTADSCTIDE